jgi:hypothetical protein
LNQTRHSPKSGRKKGPTSSNSLSLNRIRLPASKTIREVIGRLPLSPKSLPRRRPSPVWKSNHNSCSRTTKRKTKNPWKMAAIMGTLSKTVTTMVTVTTIMQLKTARLVQKLGRRSLLVQNKSTMGTCPDATASLTKMVGRSKRKA